MVARRPWFCTGRSGGAAPGAVLASPAPMRRTLVYNRAPVSVPWFAPVGVRNSNDQ